MGAGVRVCEMCHGHGPAIFRRHAEAVSLQHRVSYLIAYTTGKGKWGRGGRVGGEEEERTAGLVTQAHQCKGARSQRSPTCIAPAAGRH